MNYSLLEQLASKIPLILLTPAEEDSSLVILNVPSSLVLLTCGPPQISFEKSPMEYTFTILPYLSSKVP